MNRHAEKVVYISAPAGSGNFDPFLGGLVEETHACPGCGNIESRLV
jgi:hypothetical protein